jgi:putative DNA primase/helicase
MRDKWDEQRGAQTYGEWTVAEALARQTEHWTPPVQDAGRRRNGHEADAGFQSFADPALPYSDYTNALAMVRDHGQALRYCYPWKSWLVWTGTHWQRDESGVVMRYAKQTVKRLAQHVIDLDGEEAQALLKHVKASLATSKLKAMVESAQSEECIPVAPEAFDNNPWLLNALNGTLDLTTGALRPHERAALLTRCLPIAYDPDATCPTWLSFLWRIMGGTRREEDTEHMSAGALEHRQAADGRAQRLIAFLQRAIGYGLTGMTREQCLFVLHGGGSNGKSTFLEALQALLGDYAQSTPSASLLDKNRHDGIPNDIARLRGARLITAVEIGEGKRLNEELVKRLTGQDTLTGRFLFAEFFDFRAEFKLFIACNHLPTIRGTDHAIWRRIRLIPFTVTIPDDEQDKNLPAKLRAELPGILRWAVQGCLDWQRQGLQPPDVVQAATAGYRSYMDVVGKFLEGRCIVDVNNFSIRTHATKLYQAYRRWCEDEGEHEPMTQTAFGRRLTDRGIVAEKGKQHQTWRIGVGLHHVPDDGIDDGIRV